MPGSPVNSVVAVELRRERGDRVRTGEAERLGRREQVVIRRRVADVLAASLVAAAAHHDRGRDALETARYRLRRPLVRDVVDEHGQRRDAVIGSHGPSCYAAMPGPPTKPARVWLSPEAPAAIAAARAPRGRRDRAARTRPTSSSGTATSISARAGPARALAPARRRSSWVQLDSAGVEPWFELGLVDRRARVDVGGGRLRRRGRRARPRAAAGRSEAPGRVRAGDDLAEARAGGRGAGREHDRHRGRRRASAARRSGACEPFDVHVIASTRSGAEVPGADRSLGPERPGRAARAQRLRRALRAADARDDGPDRRARARTARPRGSARQRGARRPRRHGGARRGVARRPAAAARSWT